MITATDRNYEIFTLVHNVHREVHITFRCQSQYQMLGKPNQCYRDGTMASTEEAKESRMARNVGIIQQVA